MEVRLDHQPVVRAHRAARAAHRARAREELVVREPSELTRALAVTRTELVRERFLEVVLCEDQAAQRRGEVPRERRLAGAWSAAHDHERRTVHADHGDGRVRWPTLQMRIHEVWNTRNP